MKIMFGAWWAVLGGAGIMTANLWVAWNFGFWAAILFFGIGMWLYATGFKVING